MNEFLSQPWWAGVQGIFSVIGAVAVVVAVADFVIRRQDGAPSAMSFSVTRSQTATNGGIDITVHARVMGPKVLYEAQALTWGFEAIGLPDLPSVITARDEEIVLRLRVPVEDLPNARVGIAWVEPRRRRSYTGASRIHLASSTYEWWRVYWWARWPRKASGVWVRNRGDSKVGPLSLPAD